MVRLRPVFFLVLVLASVWSATTTDTDDVHEEEPRDYKETFKSIRGSASSSSHDQQEREPRIVGGTKAGPDQFTYFVRIDNAISGARGICGGNLVAPDIVLTAGHCLKEDLKVIVNGYNRSKKRTIKQKARQVESSKRHPQYNATTWENDFLLLKLKSGVDITPIPLNFNNSIPQTGDPLQAAGLGRRTEAGNVSFVLQTVTIPAVDQKTCFDNYSKIGRNVIQRIMLCAGADDKSPCKGDSGGPLVTLGPDRTLVGMTSWGAGCGRANYPTVFARISGAQEWLTNNICEMSDAKPAWCPKRVVVEAVPNPAPSPNQVPLFTPAVRGPLKPSPKVTAKATSQVTTKPPTPQSQFVAASVVTSPPTPNAATTTTLPPTLASFEKVTLPPSSPTNVPIQAFVAASVTSPPTAASLTASPTSSPTASLEPTSSPTASSAASEKPTMTQTASLEPSMTPTASQEPTSSPTASREPSASPTSSREPSASPTASQEPTASPTASDEPSVTPTASHEPTSSPVSTRPFEPITASDVTTGAPTPGVFVAITTADTGESTGSIVP